MARVFNPSGGRGIFVTQEELDDELAFYTKSSTFLTSQGEQDTEINGKYGEGDNATFGDLIVNGTTTNLNSTIIDMVDETIELNSDRHAITTGGLTILKEGEGGEALIQYVVADNRWVIGSDGATEPVARIDGAIPDQAFTKYDANSARLVEATATDIKTSYESNADTNAYDDAAVSAVATIADKLPLAGGTMTGNIVMAGAETVDGVDVSTLPGLITTAQTTANNALPKAGGTMTGNIVMSGAETVDGVDVSTLPGLITTAQTTADNALPKAGGTMTGNIVMSLANDVSFSGTGRLLAADGSVGAPSVSFVSSTNTGLWQPLPSVFAVSAAAVEVFRSTGAITTFNLPITTAQNISITGLGQIRAQNGAVGTPSYSFTSSTTTGMWQPVAGTIAVSASGVEVFNSTSTALTVALPTEFIGAITIPNGTVGAPGIVFKNAGTSGFYRIAPNDIGISINGNLAGQWSTTGLTIATGDFMSIPDGTAAAPSLRFSGDTNTGIYRVGADQLGITCGGGPTPATTFTTDGMTMGGGKTILTGNLTAATPAYGFVNYPGMGLYAPAANQLGISVSSANVATFTSAGLAMAATERLFVDDGSAASPPYTFTNQTNMGLYLAATNILGISTLGTMRMTIDGATIVVAPATFRPSADNTSTCGNSSFRWTTVYAVNGTIQTSDSRMKNTVAPLPTALGLSFIDSLAPKTFKWNNTVNEGLPDIVHTRTHLGFVAQDVEAAIIAAGHTLQTTDIIDNDYLVDPINGVDRYSIRMHALIAPLVKAVQELSARVSALEAVPP